MLQSTTATIELTNRRESIATPRSTHVFHLGMAIVSMAVVVAGFAPSFYLRPSTKPALSPLVIVHGIVFSSWFVLFLVQTSLAAAGFVRVHRRLGVLGAGLAILMMGLGPAVAIPAARRGALPGDPLAFLLIMLADLLWFGACVCAGILSRRRPERHKRWMLLGTLNLLPPAISRWPIAVGHPAVTGGVMLAVLAAAPVYDHVSGARVSRVSLWGGLAVIASIPLRFALSQTPIWHAVASWLIR